MRYVYLHGFASSPSSRKAQAFGTAFSLAHEALEIPALDQGNFSKLTISAQLKLLTDLLQGDPAVLIGSSMGGYLAALYASRHPEVARLALLAPAFGFAPRWTELTGVEKAREWKQNGWMDVYHYGDNSMRQVHYGLLEDALQYPEYPSFSQPAKIFHGTLDPIVPIELSRTFALQHPNAQLHEFQSGHELTDVLNQVLAEALPFLLAEAAPAVKLTPDAR